MNEQYKNWEAAIVTETFTAHWTNPIARCDGTYFDQEINQRFAEGERVYLTAWRPDGMMAVHERTGNTIFLFFKHFKNLRQLDGYTMEEVR